MFSGEGGSGCRRFAVANTEVPHGLQLSNQKLGVFGGSSHKNGVNTTGTEVVRTPIEKRTYALVGVGARR